MFPFFCSSTSSVPPLTYTLWSLSIIPKMSLPQTLPTPFFSLFSTAGAIELLHPQRQSPTPSRQAHQLQHPLSNDMYICLFLFFLSLFSNKRLGSANRSFDPTFPSTHPPTLDCLTLNSLAIYLYTIFSYFPHILFSAISTVLSICWHQSF